MSTYPSIELLLRQTQRNLAKTNAKTSAISGALMPYAARAASYFENAQKAQSGLGSALNQGMAAQGQQLASTIGSQLTDIQAPGSSLIRFATGTADTGAAAGAAIGALSTADLERLRAQGTAEQIYAAALPRLAELAGAQERRNMLAQAQQDLQDLALQQAQANYQNALNERDYQFKVAQVQLEQANANRAYQYKAAQDAKAAKLAARKQQTAEKALNAAIGQKSAAQKEKNWYDQQRADIAKFNAMTAAQRASLAGQALQEKIAYDNKRIAIQQQNANTASARAKASAAKGKGSSTAGKAWDKTHDAALKAAQGYYKGEKLHGVTIPVKKEEARRRLMSGYGKPLIGKGFSRAAVSRMIENVLIAAGY